MNIGLRSNFCIEFNFRVPQLFRYIDTQYVDLFLQEGKLRLGSYSKYREDSHQERGDANEGQAPIFAYTKGSFIASEAIIPDNSYMLCVSAIGSEIIRDKFEANDCFVISDPSAFAFEIAKNIPGCQRVLLGECNYNQYISRYFPQVSIPEGVAVEESRNFLDKILADEVFFHKGAKYAPQYEYRFVFVTDRKVDQHIEIVSLRAASLCDRGKLM